VVKRGSTTFSPANSPTPKLIDTTETPGPWCFPPLATLITGAARLMLALLERSVRDAGGSYVFCDTDSMALARPEDLPGLARQIRAALVQHRVANRPDRYEPRARKRRYDNYQHLRMPRAEAKARLRRGTYE